MFRLVNHDDRTMLTACVAAIGGRMLDRSCRGSAAMADSAADVHDCTKREDAESGIKRSLSRRKNHVFIPNQDGNDSEFYEEAASSSDEDETFPNAWLTEENETVEMAALVLWCLHSDMMDVCGTSTSFPYLILLENGPKAAKIEDETWWRPYWTDAEVEKAKISSRKK